MKFIYSSFAVGFFLFNFFINSSYSSTGNIHNNNISNPLDNNAYNAENLLEIEDDIKLPNNKGLLENINSFKKSLIDINIINDINSSVLENCKSSIDLLQQNINQYSLANNKIKNTTQYSIDINEHLSNEHLSNEHPLINFDELLNVNANISNFSKYLNYTNSFIENKYNSIISKIGNKIVTYCYANPKCGKWTIRKLKNHFKENQKYIQEQYNKFSNKTEILKDIYKTQNVMLQILDKLSRLILNKEHFLLSVNNDGIMYIQQITQYIRSIATIFLRKRNYISSLLSLNDTEEIKALDQLIKMVNKAGNNVKIMLQLAFMDQVNSINKPTLDNLIMNSFQNLIYPRRGFILEIGSKLMGSKLKKLEDGKSIQELIKDSIQKKQISMNKLNKYRYENNQLITLKKRKENNYTNDFYIEI